MFVIVEGPDKAGKTTLVRGLAQIFNARVEKHVHEPDDVILKRVEELMSNDVEKPVIYDRWYSISDPIYSPVMRNKPSVLADKLPRIERRLNELGAILLLLTFRRPEIAVNRFYKSGGDDYVTAEQLVEIIRGYDNFTTSLRCIRIYVDELDARRVLKMAACMTASTLAEQVWR